MTYSAADNRTASWTPFIFVALALAAGTMGATMASPLYPIYESQWSLNHSTITIVYVVYMMGVLAAFLFLGRLSGLIGPIAVLKGGSTLLLAGLLLSAFASNVIALGIGRALIGIASGMITSSATLGLLLLEPGGNRYASLVASVTTMAGFGLGPLVCGIVAQSAPAPLFLPYIVVIIPVIAILVGLIVIRSGPTAPERQSLSFRPQLGMPSGVARPGFLVVSFAVFSAYALFSLLASLAPSFLAELIPWNGPAVSGTAVAAVLLCSALVQVPSRRLSTRFSMSLALLLMGTGAVLLALALRNGSPAVFVVADLSIGLGHGLSFMSGLGLVGRVARANERSAILATFLSIAYLGTIAPILAVGYLADHIGLLPAVTVFCLTFAALCLLLALLARQTLRPGRIPAAEEAS